MELLKVKQGFSAAKIDYIKQMQEELSKPEIKELALKDMRIAICLPSRGIHQFFPVVKTLVDWLKKQGARPMIVPAMGSHGASTAVGQTKVLAKYGITEETLGVPVVSSLDVVKLGYCTNGAPVYISKDAYEADGFIVINRIKPHTLLKGPLESGILKILAVGLGKQKGAESMHTYGLQETIPEASRLIIKKTNFIFGLGVVENYFGDIYHLEAVPAFRVVEREPELLEMARENFPRLPFDPLDILAVKEMGKNISGSGLDTNIIGRWRRIGNPASSGLDREFTEKACCNLEAVIDKIVVFSLTGASEGNATGVGMADVITRQLYEAIDFEATYQNAFTSGFLNGSKIPVIAASEKEALNLVMKRFSPDTVKLAYIKNTQELAEFYVTPAVLEGDQEGAAKVTVLGREELSLDEPGHLNLSF